MKKMTKEQILRFSPTAWSKMIFMRDMTENEVGGFGITRKDDLLFVEDIVIIKQKVSVVTVSFDDNAVADYFEDQAASGKTPQQYARIWIHTHPGDSPQPSMTDKETFKRVFGSCDWSVMFILAQDDSCYAKLSFNAGPGGQMDIPVKVDYSLPFDASNFDLWEKQYKENVSIYHYFEESGEKPKRPKKSRTNEFLDQFEDLSFQQRHTVLDELAANPDLWDSESEVMFI